MTIRKTITVSEAEYDAIECALMHARPCAKDEPYHRHKVDSAAIESALEAIRIPSWR